MTPTGFNVREGSAMIAERIAEVDFDARYKVAGYGGIAFYLIGYATEWTEEEWTWDGGDDDDRDDPCNYLYSEPEEVEDRTRVVAIMVGDDYKHTVDVDDLEVIADDDYCHECGQIGCRGDGWPRDDD